MCSWYPLASYAAPAAVANAAPGVQPQAATPAAPIVVGEPTATLAEPTAPAAVAENVPQREVKLSFATIAPPPGSIVLRGSRPDASVEFGMRSDELVANALLNLEYTPSPSLLPVQSQLKVYLNDELMGVLPVTKEQLGKKIRAQLPIDPLYITDFNRVRLEFVGHYRDVCENPASSTLWLDVGRESYLDLTYQSLKVNNDLSHFPVPFYDPRDNRPLKLPMIFPGSPAVTQQQAAAIVASWFGSKAGWRGQQFPVYFNELPDRNAIVFATNDKRPDFLRDHPPVKAPTQGQVATLLQALGGIGSQTGLAAINLQMTDDGNQIKNKDADLLLIGAIPSSLKDDTKINLLVEATKSWVKMPMRHYDLASIYPDDEARTPNTRTDITSSGPMAAVIGFQSPYNDQRSVVALLADSPRGNELLTNALNDSGKRAAMFGSVAVIRESGVNSLRVGDIYYVGHLPWFERIWFALSNHPILLAIFAAISIVLLAWVLWRMLRIISRRRLSLDDE
ncbi:cellulose synthase regulator protein [Klebsiella pneumoniae]|nr:cellulose synthase regulator protein [Klebsiella pneumoniae]